MEKQNVTLSLLKALLKKVKLMAVKRAKSMRQFLIEALEEKIREDRGYKKARERHLRLLRTGFDLGTKEGITNSREELHAGR